MRVYRRWNAARLMLMLLVALMLAACGGGGSEGDNPAADVEPSGGDDGDLNPNAGVEPPTPTRRATTEDATPEATQTAEAGAMLDMESNVESDDIFESDTSGGDTLGDDSFEESNGELFGE